MGLGSPTNLNFKSEEIPAYIIYTRRNRLFSGIREKCQIWKREFTFIKKVSLSKMDLFRPG